MRCANKLETVSTFYDITIPVREGLAVWPGDTPYSFALGWDMAAGASVNVGAVTMSAHTGTHADAPFHFLPAGAAIDAIDPAVYVGPCVVADVRGLDPIPADALAALDLSGAPRLLLKTGGWPDHTRFPDEVPVIAPDVPDLLTAHGVVLLGVDVPSVDRVESKDLPNHHALAARGVHIVESLDLSAVPPGRYHLTALPLRLAGADASPVRAVLTTLTAAPGT
jgi:arylformamidase